MSLLERKYNAYIEPSHRKMRRMVPITFSQYSSLSPAYENTVETVSTTAVHIADEELVKLRQDLDEYNDVVRFIRERGLARDFEFWQTLDRLKR